MAEDNADQGWRKSLRNARHVDGSREDLVDRHQASVNQSTPVADLNSPGNMISRGKPSEFATKPKVELDKKIKPLGFEI